MQVIASPRMKEPNPPGVPPTSLKRRSVMALRLPNDWPVSIGQAEAQNLAVCQRDQLAA
jgi:hypothetical protein